MGLVESTRQLDFLRQGGKSLPAAIGIPKDIADFHYFSFQSADTYHQPVYLSSS